MPRKRSGNADNTAFFGGVELVDTVCTETYERGMASHERQ
jgi:hypothetical protein